MSVFFKARGEHRSANWFGAGETNNRIPVTDDSALRLTSVFAAYRHIVDYVSTLPVDAYRLVGDERQKVPSPPQLLARQDEDGGPGLISWLGQAAYGLSCGNAVGWILDTDGYGYPTDIAWIHWSQWSYQWYTRQWYVFGHPVPSSQIVHIPWIVPPGRTLGLSPIEQLASVIIAGLSAVEYADLKRGGGIPPSILKNTKKELLPEVAKAAQTQAAASFAKGKPFVTGADWDLSMLSIPPNQAQFAETLKMSANQVAAAFGIDPTEIGGQAANSLTYSTEELREIRRAADMQSYLIRIERGLSRYLPAKQYLKFNTDAKIRADLKTRNEVHQLALRNGWETINEVRALEERPPVDWGDEPFLPAMGPSAAAAAEKTDPNTINDPNGPSPTQKPPMMTPNQMPPKRANNEGDSL